MVVPTHDVEFIPSTPTLMGRRGRLEDSTHVFGKMGRLGPRMKELGCPPGTLVPGEADEEVQGQTPRQRARGRDARCRRPGGKRNQSRGDSDVPSVTPARRPSAKPHKRWEGAGHGKAPSRLAATPEGSSAASLSHTCAHRWPRAPASRCRPGHANVHTPLSSGTHDRPGQKQPPCPQSVSDHVSTPGQPRGGKTPGRGGLRDVGSPGTASSAGRSCGAGDVGGWWVSWGAPDVGAVAAGYTVHPHGEGGHEKPCSQEGNVPHVARTHSTRAR